MFAELLDHVLNETPGALCVTLMGFDGIAIETRECASPAAGDSETWQAAAVEISHITTQLKSISDGMGTGGVDEVTVTTDALVTVVRPLSSEYLIALSMTPSAHHGKGRYLMRVAAPKLKKELL